MSRVRVLADPVSFRRQLVSLVESALADAEPTRPITVRAARTAKAVRIDVVNEPAGAPSEGVIGSMTLPLPRGASSAVNA